MQKILFNLNLMFFVFLTYLIFRASVSSKTPEGRSKICRQYSKKSKRENIKARAKNLAQTNKIVEISKTRLNRCNGVTVVLESFNLKPPLFFFFFC